MFESERVGVSDQVASEEDLASGLFFFLFGVVDETHFGGLTHLFDEENVNLSRQRTIPKRRGRLAG